jgi:phosphoglycolate phosphatase
MGPEQCFEWQQRSGRKDMTPLSEIKALLFDKDGTILDYEKTWLPINRELAMMAASGDAKLADELLRVAGHDPETDKVAPGSPFAVGGIEALVGSLVKHLGPTRTPPRLLERTGELFATGGAKYSVLLPGARDTLVALKKRGYVLGIATNDTEAGLQGSLGQHDVLSLCQFSCGCDSGYGEKPAPGMVHAFCKAVGIAPKHVAVIGDSTHDLHMATSAGAGLRVAVLSGTGRKADLVPHADLTLESVVDLLSHLT